MRNRDFYEDRAELLDALKDVLNAYEDLAYQRDMIPDYDVKTEKAKMIFRKFGGYWENDRSLSGQPWQVEF